jgi:cobalt/nickel transport system permease protein
MRRDFLEKTLRRLGQAMEWAGQAEVPGPLSRLDPRVKLAGFLGLICAAAASHRPAVTLALWAVGVTLAGLSGRLVFRASLRLWAGVFLFTLVIVSPSLFLTPGPVAGWLPGVP